MYTCVYKCVCIYVCTHEERQWNYSAYGSWLVAWEQPAVLWAVISLYLKGACALAQKQKGCVCLCGLLAALRQTQGCVNLPACPKQDSPLQLHWAAPRRLHHRLLEPVPVLDVISRLVQYVTCTPLGCIFLLES